MKRVLVVDDDWMNCVMAKGALGDNYEVDTVNSGEEALAFMERQPVDLVLMDIMMPGMSGKETAQRIKEKEEWKEIPLIFLTADSDPATEVECLKWGADDFIIKPFVPLVMNTRVSRILEIYELRRELQLKLEKRTKQMETATLKSLTDALTGIHNRDYLVKHLTEWLEKGGVGTLFMIDLDNFKTMNDTYGHIMGDTTLQKFAQILKEYSKEGDMVCRLAGDEFVTFYPNLTDRKEAGDKAQNIIRKFSEEMGEMGYGGIVSVSIGIMLTSGGEDFQTIYNQADKALYVVKENGKNAYLFYGDGTETMEEITTTVDLEYVRGVMEKGISEQKGAFHMAFEEFKNVYDFILRCVSRKHQKVQIVLFTMEELKKPMNVGMEEVMQRWEQAMISTLRSMDTGARYSNCQYLAVLMDTNDEHGRIAADRLIERFYESNRAMQTEVKVTYDVRTM